MREPICRQQKWPLPEMADVLKQTQAARLRYLELIHPWTHSESTEHEREGRDDELELDNAESED